MKNPLNIKTFINPLEHINSMTEEIIDTLESIGLSQNEAKVYFALVKTGTATATEIAKESKLHRPNVYDSLKSLMEKGLVSHITEEKKTLFRAADPKNLSMLLKQQEADLAKILPVLELEAKLAKNKESVTEVHTGLKALRLAFFNMLEHNKPIFAFGVPKIAPQVVASFIDNFHRERIKKKIMFKHIYNEDAKERMKYLNSLPYTEAAYLPEQFNSPVSTITAGPEILLIRWQPIVFIRIVDLDFAEAYQKYCEKLLEATRKI